jgi:hypothetical protein
LYTAILSSVIRCLHPAADETPSRAFIHKSPNLPAEKVCTSDSELCAELIRRSRKASGLQGGAHQINGRPIQRIRILWAYRQHTTGSLKEEKTA